MSHLFFSKILKIYSLLSFAPFINIVENFIFYILVMTVVSFIINFTFISTFKISYNLSLFQHKKYYITNFLFFAYKINIWLFYYILIINNNKNQKISSNISFS